MSDTHITISKDDLVDLAHYFFLWKDAHCSGNHIGVSIFGDWLLRLQDRTGTEVAERDFLVRSIDRANELAIV
jgi:hypothetical protein